MKRSAAGKTSEASTSISTDDTGKRNRHGAPFSSIVRWIRRNSIFAGILSLSLIAACTYTFFLSPPPNNNKSLITPLVEQSIPPCPTQPWKPHEDMRGKCPGDLKPFPPATTISACASTCCSNPSCITWQFRSDVGCLQGGDVRLGMEKDGVAAWCSDHPPQRWRGQYLYKKGGTGEEDAEIRARGCDSSTWNPEEQVGQCFGLGDVKKDASGSAEECRDACCGKEKCRAWQWNEELGCFYGSHMHGCQGDDGDPVKFDPFVGRRKFLATRQYIDNSGKPWQMTL
ncbi:hypothetical protein HJC23_011969 [Cyclotella cryptica]|uniref:Apple domain-containing protein n=1 Tax=Cyclotella cryptica TaxID=29204 RepID=A0ABD3QQF9_9STRA